MSVFAAICRVILYHFISLLAIRCISRDSNCSRFLGHQGGVLTIAVPTFLQQHEVTEQGSDLAIALRQQRGRANPTASAAGLRLRALKGEKHRPGKSSLSETLQACQ